MNTNTPAERARVIEGLRDIQQYAVHLGASYRTLCGQAADLLAASPLRAPAAGREEIDEEVVMQLLRKSGLNQQVIRAVTYTSWKDGIDIDRPTFNFMAFVLALSTRQDST